MKRKQTLAYDVILEPSDEGGYTAYVPALRACASEGDSEEEALESIKDSIALWLETWEQVAVDKGALLRRVEIVR